MPYSQKQLFAKTFWWALVGSALFAGFFLVVIALTNAFHGPGGADKFTNGLLFSSIFGTLCGAGLVGWRIVDKYQHARLKYWVRRYLTLSFASIVVAIGLLYTPVTGLLAIWSVIASLLVQLALSKRSLWFTKRT